MRHDQETKFRSERRKGRYYEKGSSERQKGMKNVQTLSSVRLSPRHYVVTIGPTALSLLDVEGRACVSGITHDWR